MIPKPRIAILKDFLKALDRIPERQRRKTRAFIERFEKNPTAASINYESIHDMADKRVRTVRIDQKYRAIVLHPDKGNTYVLAWVDNHDEAMAWAKHKRFSVNPETGAFQIIDTEFVSQKQKEPIQADTTHTLFNWLSEDDLLKIGLPKLLLPAIRPIKSQDELDQLASYLPEEVYETLAYIAMGASVPEAMAMARPATPPRIIDVTDIDTALTHPDSLRRVAIVESADDLQAMLDAPLADWRVFLHPSQRQLVRRHFNGPARVLGGAGTGKTVVAMHRARYLAKEVFTKSKDRILFTTYTRNLAQSIEDNLRHLCRDEMKRIEVTNLHRWAAAYLKNQGVLCQVAEQNELSRYWQTAILEAGDGAFEDDFYPTEWANVVKANGLSSKREYFRIQRRGQGLPLMRKQRAAVWKVFEVFQTELQAAGQIEYADLITMAREHLELNSNTLPYRGIIVDEVQDLFPEELRLLRAIVPAGANDLFFVGDAHQRIYSAVPVVMSQVGIFIRGRAHKLRINYRTTERIKQWAVGVLNNLPIDDLDGGIDDLQTYKSLRLGQSPQIVNLKTEAEEVAFIVGEIERLVLEMDVSAESICIAARASRLLTPFKAAFDAKNIEHQVISGSRTRSQTDAVHLATMHRVKGLEFGHVFLVSVNDGIMPSRWSLEEDEDAHLERCLLHVASTRARDSLTLSSYGIPSRLLQSAT